MHQVVRITMEPVGLLAIVNIHSHVDRKPPGLDGRQVGADNGRPRILFGHCIYQSDMFGARNGYCVEGFRVRAHRQWPSYLHEHARLASYNGSPSSLDLHTDAGSDVEDVGWRLPDI